LQLTTAITNTTTNYVHTYLELPIYLVCRELAPHCRYPALRPVVIRPSVCI
jgi:hypothetical protein